MATKTIKIFASNHCTPCADVINLIAQGRFTSDLGEDIGVQIIDIETEEGYQELQSYDVSGVPDAFHGDQRCRILVDDEAQIVILACKLEEGNPGTQDPGKGT